MKLVWTMAASIFLTMTSPAGAQSSRGRGDGGPTVGARNAPPNVSNDSTNQRNTWRQKIVNDILRKRGSPNTVTAQIYSLQLGITWRSFGASLYETTLGTLNRGLLAANPFGPKASFTGLHPRFVQYRFRDREGELLLGECFLAFYHSKLIPGRAFVRSYSCSVTENARTLQNYKGFEFAAVVEVNRQGRVQKYKDVTADLKANAQFDSIPRAAQYLTDGTLFEDPNRAQDQGGGGGRGGDDDDFPPGS